MIRVWHRDPSRALKTVEVYPQPIVTPASQRQIDKSKHDRKIGFEILCAMRQEARDLVAGWRAR